MADRAARACRRCAPGSIGATSCATIPTSPTPCGASIRCPGWDPAYNFTLGREPINPRPVFYARLHDRLAPDTDGFISYSDGVNDDVNKIVLTRKAWDPRPGRAEHPDRLRPGLLQPGGRPQRAADGLLALERNWEGPLAENGSVAATLTLWQQIEREAPELGTSWRWQMALLRAYYDAYTRERLRLETAPRRRGQRRARRRTARRDPRPRWIARWRSSRVRPAAAVRTGTPGIDALGAALFESIRMQTERAAAIRRAATSVARCSTSSIIRSTTGGGSRTSSRGSVTLGDEAAKVCAAGHDSHLGQPGPRQLLRRHRQRQRLAAPRSGAGRRR